MNKCTLGRKRLTKTLASSYNLIILNQHHPATWVKILNIMLETGKVTALGKLGTLQLVEEVFQLLMRMFENKCMVEIIENEDRISK